MTDIEKIEAALSDGIASIKSDEVTSVGELLIKYIDVQNKIGEVVWRQVAEIVSQTHAAGYEAGHKEGAYTAFRSQEGAFAKGYEEALEKVKSKLGETGWACPKGQCGHTNLDIGSVHHGKYIGMDTTLKEMHALLASLSKKI